MFGQRATEKGERDRGFLALYRIPGETFDIVRLEQVLDIASFFGNSRMRMMLRMFCREVVNRIEADERIMVMMRKYGKYQQDKTCEV